jgi:hypothetical protein
VSDADSDRDGVGVGEGCGVDHAFPPLPPPVPEASSARVFASLWTFDPGSFAEFRTRMSPEAEAKPGADAQPLGEGMDVAEVRRALKIG